MMRNEQDAHASQIADDRRILIVAAFAEESLVPEMPISRQPLHQGIGQCGEQGARPVGK